MRFSSLDWFFVAAFFAVLVGIALLCSRRAGKDAKDFFLSGRSMPWGGRGPGTERVKRYSETIQSRRECND